jgi:Putative Actinobacterial Holin-X, holin superfamily III
MPRDAVKDEPLLASLHKLTRDGRSWVAAEAALAQAEVASDGKRIALMLALSVIALGCLFAAVMVLTLALVAFLAPHVGGMANAAGLLSLALLLITGLSAWRIWYLASKEFGVLSILKRWWNFAAAGPGRET